MFQGLYKQSFSRCERQEVRRKQLLQQQKLKRLEEQDGYRHYEDVCDDKEWSSRRKNKNTSIEHVHLQFSEWFKEKPDNLNDWVLVPCPQGQRCLVVAEKGKTKMFNKNKKHCMTFSSLIPGGGLLESDGSCMLDCVYCKEIDTFYVLDSLHFFIPLVDCDSEFRFFWLKSKFNELDLEMEYKSGGIKRFKLLENYDVSDDARLAMALQTYPLWQENQPKLDGFLFYHKKTHYTFGTTPLVCWLFPFMLPDILQLPVSSGYKTPINYCKGNPLQYMDEFDKELAKKRSRNANRDVLNTTSMEDNEPIEETFDENIHRKDDLLEALLAAEKMLELEESCL